MLSSAMQVSWQRTLDTLRPAAACAEAVAMKVRNLVLSKKGGIVVTARNAVPPMSVGILWPKGRPRFAHSLHPTRDLRLGAADPAGFYLKRFSPPAGYGLLLFFLLVTKSGTNEIPASNLR